MLSMQERIKTYHYYKTNVMLVTTEIILHPELLFRIGRIPIFS